MIQTIAFYLFATLVIASATLTIMALAVRSTDYLMEEMKRGNV